MIFFFFNDAMSLGNYCGPRFLFFFNILKNIQGPIVQFDLALWMGFAVFFTSYFLVAHFSTSGKE